MSIMQQMIANHPLLEGIPDDELELVMKCASFQNFSPSQNIFREGEDAKHCYLILEGTVILEIFNLEIGNIHVQTLGPGEVLGWSWLVPPFNWHFDARAVDSVKTIALDGEMLRQTCEENPRLGYNLLKKFAAILEQRLQATRRQLFESYGISK